MVTFIFKPPHPLYVCLTLSLSCRVEKGMVRLPSHFFSIL